MANILNKTAAQMTADGYSIAYGAGERIQMWSGVQNGDTMVFRVFDSIGNRAMQVNESGPRVLVPFALAVPIVDLINASSLGAGQKTALINGIINALDRL